MVQVVVIDFSLFGAVAIYQRQGFEAVRFVQVGAVLIPGFFGDQAIALPEEFGSCQAVGFGDTAAEGVVFVVPGAAIRCGDARESVLAVVAIPSGQFLAFTSTFLNQVAEFVVLESQRPVAIINPDQFAVRVIAVQNLAAIG